MDPPDHRKTGGKIRVWKLEPWQIEIFDLPEVLKDLPLGRISLEAPLAAKEE